jgi:hypothetical protein
VEAEQLLLVQELPACMGCAGALHDNVSSESYANLSPLSNAPRRVEKPARLFGTHAFSELNPARIRRVD